MFRCQYYQVNKYLIRYALEGNKYNIESEASTYVARMKRRHHGNKTSKQAYNVETLSHDLMSWGSELKMFSAAMRNVREP